MVRFLAIFLLTPFICPGQNEDPVSGELLEIFFQENEQASESDAQLFLEMLENLRSNPLDLNKASREDLAALRLLNEIQVENFLAYRALFGTLLNQYELQAIPGWELEDIRRLLPFITVNSGIEARTQPLFRGFYAGSNELLMRWGRSVPANYPAGAEGAPDAYAFRYRHTFDNRLRFGFTAENDPGEAFFRGSNRQGFDFYSAHLFFQNVNTVIKTVAMGDFSARFGQGLLLQTGFSPGKSAETTAIARNARKLNAYSSFGEAYFLRGAAATINLAKNWEITALVSFRKRDANIDSTDQSEFADQVFTALQSSGLHRTNSEIADEKAIQELLGGFSVSRLWKNGQITLNGLHIQYDKPWQPATAPYRQFGFTGKSLTGGSLDYFWRKRNWYFFGEIARSDNGGMAGINGLLFAVDRRVTLAVLQRSFGRDYQTIYAAPFAETSGAANENGVYLGGDVRFGRRWQINVYADVWKHPWLRFGVSAPSSGSEYLGRLIWTPKRGVSVYFLSKFEVKERDQNVNGFKQLAENRLGRFRLHASYKLGPALEMRSRLEWTTFRIGDSGVRSSGFLAYQEAVIRLAGFPVYGSLRYAIFDTDDYDTRVYTFENDLFSAISIPAFAGRGTRYFLNINWRVNQWLRLEGRLEQTLQQLAVTDSGQTGRKTFYKIQARMQF